MQEEEEEGEDEKKRRRKKKDEDEEEEEEERTRVILNLTLSRHNEPARQSSRQIRSDTKFFNCSSYRMNE